MKDKSDPLDRLLDRDPASVDLTDFARPDLLPPTDPALSASVRAAKAANRAEREILIENELARAIDDLRGTMLNDTLMAQRVSAYLRFPGEDDLTEAQYVEAGAASVRWYDPQWQRVSQYAIASKLLWSVRSLATMDEQARRAWADRMAAMVVKTYRDVLTGRDATPVTARAWAKARLNLLRVSEED
jgi:hypothetical protein